MRFVIKAWVAVQITELDCPNGMSGTVLGDFTSPLGYTDGPVAPSGAPDVYASQLVQ
jgi:hypothetical protein